jgi:hypothetical protein
MPVSFSVIPVQRSSEVLDFVHGVFGFTETPPNFAPATVEWKYFAPHPWWLTGRSYVLETDKGIAAHGCVSPVRFAGAETVLEAVKIIDWAAGRIVPGAGLLLWRRCLELQKGLLLAIGGSQQTLNILQEVKWFVPQTDLRYYVKPFHPWRRFSRSQGRLRDWLKLGRNAHWRMIPPLPAPGLWRCRPATPSDDVFNPVGNFLPILRSRTWLDYLCACPIASCTLLILERDGAPNGHALVANRAGSALIADFALGGERTPQAKGHAFAALLRFLSEQHDLLEVVAGSSIREDCRVFETCGLRFRRSAQVSVADPHHLIDGEMQLEINPMIGDAFYLYDAANPFWT